jgi:ankyrin repeat protein
MNNALRILLLFTMGMAFVVHSAAIADTDEGRDLPSLTWAALDGQKDLVKRLLGEGQNVNQLDQRGWTPLMAAADEGHIDIVRLLIDWGADINAKRKDDGYTALMIASYKGRADIVKLLIECGAKVDARDSRDHSALFHAVVRGQSEIVKILAENGADVNASFETLGRTPLTLASSYGYPEVVKVLLEHGANVNAKSNAGWAALCYAEIGSKVEDLTAGERAWYSETIRLLRAAGAKPDACD